MRLKTVLKNARKLVAREGGWSQGRYRTRVNVNRRTINSYCLVGAIMQADCNNDPPRFFEATEVMSQVIKNCRPMYNGCLTAWNDFSGRTQQDVIRAFDRAIEAQG